MPQVFRSSTSRAQRSWFQIPGNDHTSWPFWGSLIVVGLFFKWAEQSELGLELMTPPPPAAIRSARWVMPGSLHLSASAVIVTHLCTASTFFTLLSWLPTFFKDTFPDAKVTSGSSPFQRTLCFYLFIFLKRDISGNSAGSFSARCQTPSRRCALVFALEAVLANVHQMASQ